MEHGGELISTIALGLSAAFLAGLVAGRLRLPSIVGYLLAGVALGPFTPGLIADQEIATELAEIGVILLMFGVVRRDTHCTTFACLRRHQVAEYTVVVSSMPAGYQPVVPRNQSSFSGDPDECVMPPYR